MTGAPRYWLTRAAEADLNQIAVYTLETWGENQLLAYQKQLEQRLQSLLAFPDLDRKHPMLANDVRYICEGKHYLFYRRCGYDITVLRFLHCRGDLLSKLAAFL
jgi:toxin ParE1/3/4